jgi:hypothetical protein
MEPKDNRPQPFHFKDQRQFRIHQRLGQLVGPGAASFYRDACMIMIQQLSLESTTHLVAHMLREIDSTLLSVLLPYANEKDVPERENEGHKTNVKKVLKTFGLEEETHIAITWLSLVGHDSSTIHGRTHRNDLDSPRPVDDEFRDFCRKFDTVMDSILDKFESRYNLVFKLLDKLLSEPSPTGKIIKKLKNEIPNNFVSRKYFFDHLTHTQWVEPLAKKGFFNSPPQLERDDESNTTSFPVWPESRYLARMAPEAPDTVLKVIEKIETDNYHVRLDIAKAGAAMPSAQAACMVSVVKKWEGEYFNFILLPAELGKLVGLLANGGHANEAFELASSLLKIPSSGNMLSGNLGWAYNELLESILNDLWKIKPNPTFELLCKKLNEAIEVNKMPDGINDRSLSWRPVIEDHEQNRIHRFAIENVLVTSIRDIPSDIVKEKGSEIFQRLESQPFPVFHRIALHLRRVYWAIDREGTEKIVLEKLPCDDRYWKHEMNMLLREHFATMSDYTKKTYLSMIEDEVGMKKWISAEQEEGTPKEKIEKRVQNWKYSKLRPIQKHLEGKWLTQFEEYRNEFGKGDDHDFMSFTVSRCAFESPKTLDELRSWSDEEIIEYLKKWEGQHDLMGPSAEGLREVLSSLASLEPERFSACAKNFIDTDPIYVRGLLTGIESVVKKDKKLDWFSILELCAWVVKQDREIPNRQSRYADIDPGWVWARQTIANLLEKGFGSEGATIPYELRNQAWDVLELLTYDPQPTLEDEREENGYGGPPENVSLNTVRGKAMHAVMYYALWIRRHNEQQTNKDELIKKGFDEIPEVRDVLAKHLDPEYDPSPAIRSVYGQWFPWLHLLDPAWTTEHIGKIFTHDELWDAAWSTYVMFCQPYLDFFNLLKNEYAYAIGDIKQEKQHRARFANPNDRLAEHLMIYYWHDSIGLDAPGNILPDFFAKAPASVRGHAISFIGENLSNTEEKVDSETIERLKLLWMRRIEEAQNADEKDDYKPEMSAFGRWFASGRLDSQWAINELKSALSISGKISSDHSVIEQLAMIAPQFPLESVECFRLMAEGDKEGWLIESWKEDALTLLRAALGSDIAKDAAEEIVNRLLAKGLNGAFRDLLSNSGSSEK